MRRATYAFSFSIVMLILLLVGTLALTFNIQPVKTSGTIYIRADGSIDPPTANITTADNVTYTFTGTINDFIVIERNNIVVDGAGYSVQGAGTGTGISLRSRSNVTLKNVEVTNFTYGIFLYDSSSNTITGNTASNNDFGILLYSFSSNNTLTGNNASNNFRGISLYDSSSNTITGNTASNNTYGIYLYASSNNDVFHNNLIGNTLQAIVAGIIDTNTWDNGCEGNYWSDYNGTDSDGDGIGDTPYVVDENNQDNYPLMNYYWNPADIDHDLDVDIYDIVRACNSYGSTPSDPNWNGHCDIAEPYGVIDIYDIVMIAGSYGEEYLP